MFRFGKKKDRGNRGHEPPASPFKHSPLLDQSIAEMLGLIRRVLADGVVSAQEADDLARWTETHPEVVDAWPGKVLAHRLEKIFQDGKVDDEERQDLQRLLRALVTGDWGVRQSGGGPGGLPISEPPPVLVFPEQCFAFAGEFAFGSISACRRAVEELGGRASSEIGTSVDILVIGTFGSTDWADSKEADEIQRAMELEKAGHPIAIVSEDYWASSLP